MRSMFATAHFQKFDLGRHLLSQQVSPGVYSILDTLGVSEDDINKLIDKVSPELAPQYKQRLQDCKAKGIETASGLACLYSLYNEIKNSSNKPTTPIVVAPAPSSFPIIPVIAGVGALALIFVLLKNKKSAPRALPAR